GRGGPRVRPPPQERWRGGGEPGKRRHDARAADGRQALHEFGARLSQPEPADPPVLGIADTLDVALLLQPVAERDDRCRGYSQLPSELPTASLTQVVDHLESPELRQAQIQVQQDGHEVLADGRSEAVQRLDYRLQVRLGCIHSAAHTRWPNSYR